MRLQSREITPAGGLLPELGRTTAKTLLKVESAFNNPYSIRKPDDGLPDQLNLPDVIDGMRPVWIAESDSCVNIVGIGFSYPIITRTGDDHLVLADNRTGQVLRDYGAECQFIPGCQHQGAHVVNLDGTIVEKINSITGGQIIDSGEPLTVEAGALTGMSSVMAHSLHHDIGGQIGLAKSRGNADALIELYGGMEKSVFPYSKNPLQQIINAFNRQGRIDFKDVSEDRSIEADTVMGDKLPLVVRFLANCITNAQEVGDEKPVIIYQHGTPNDMLLVLSHTQILPDHLDQIGIFGASTKGEKRGTGLATVATLATNCDAGMFVLSGTNNTELRRLTGFGNVDYNKLPADFDDGTDSMRTNVMEVAKKQMQENDCSIGFAIVYPHRLPLY